MFSEASIDRPRHQNPLRLPIRFLLYWLVKAVVLLFLGVRLLLRPRAVRYGLLVLLVGCAVAWRTLGAPAWLPWATTSSAQGETVSTAVTTKLPQPAAAERYFKSQAAYEASGMWETMNDQLKRKMVAASNSQEQLQAALETARQQQRKYGAVDYIGGESVGGGKSLYFYVLTVNGPNGPTQIPYTFTVDQDGKISNIQWSMG
jgi:hypothetical protein